MHSGMDLSNKTFLRCTGWSVSLWRTQGQNESHVCSMQAYHQASVKVILCEYSRSLIGTERVHLSALLEAKPQQQDNELKVSIAY